MTSSQKPSKKQHPKRPPATTPEARETQLVALAVDVVQQQLEEGTASAQVLTHFLRIATVREKLELERLRAEIELRRMQTEVMASNKNAEEISEKALEAFKRYSRREEG